MDLEAIMAEIDELSLHERICIVQRVLDGVAEQTASMNKLELTPEFRAELDRRIAEADAHPERGIPWEVVEAELIAREYSTDE